MLASLSVGMSFLCELVSEMDENVMSSWFAFEMRVNDGVALAFQSECWRNKTQSSGLFLIHILFLRRLL